jgi:hypothetical protein
MPFALKGVQSDQKMHWADVILLVGSSSDFVSFGVYVLVIYDLFHRAVKDSVFYCRRKKRLRFLKYGVWTAVGRTQIINNHCL